MCDVSDTNKWYETPYNIVNSGSGTGGLKYDNTIVQIKFLKDYFTTSLSREKLNIDRLEIVRTDTILYHIYHHLFREDTVESYSPKESCCIYFEISW